MQRTPKIELSSIKLKVIRDIRIVGRACNHSLKNRLVAERERSSFFCAPHHRVKPSQEQISYKRFVAQDFFASFRPHNSLFFVIVDVDSRFISLILVCYEILEVSAWREWCAPPNMGGSHIPFIWHLRTSGKM